MDLLRLALATYSMSAGFSQDFPKMKKQNSLLSSN